MPLFSTLSPMSPHTSHECSDWSALTREPSRSLILCPEVLRGRLAEGGGYRIASGWQDMLYVLSLSSEFLKGARSK